MFGLLFLEHHHLNVCMAEEEEVLVPQGKTEEEEEEMEKDLPESPEERQPVDRIKLGEQDQEEAQLSSSGGPSGTKQQQSTRTQPVTLMVLCHCMVPAQLYSVQFDLVWVRTDSFPLQLK